MHQRDSGADFTQIESLKIFASSFLVSWRWPLDPALIALSCSPHVLEMFLAAEMVIPVGDWLVLSSIDQDHSVRLSPLYPLHPER